MKANVRTHYPPPVKTVVARAARAAARAVACDLLRQAGDEQGARVLERAQDLIDAVHDARVHDARVLRGQWAFDLLAYLDPTWAAAEVERAHGEALGMREALERSYETMRRATIQHRLGFHQGGDL